MKEFELIQQLKTGNSTVYSKWTELHSGSIERFAIQYGCEKEQAARVAEETFSEFYNNLENLKDGEQLVHILYKATIEKLQLIEPVKLAHKNSFSFEEDEKLHEKIILLDKEQKTAFILSRFHELDIAGIAKVLDLSETTVELATSEAYKQLEEQVTQLKKRLAFLGKSYSRLTLLFNIENVFQRPPEQKEPLVKQKKVLSKKVLFAWVAGIVILLTLITVSVVTGEEYQNASTEKYVERLKESFENEVAEKSTEVGLPEERLIDEEIYPVFFAESAKDEFETMMGKLERQITSNEKMNKKEIKRQYDKILSNLELPAEMTDHLFENPLTDDKEKSEEFIERYVEMVLNLQQSYLMTFSDYEHEQIFEDATIDGEIDIEKFLEEKDSYPKDLQNALEGMVKQNIYPISLKDSAPFYPVHVNKKISKRIRDLLHEDVGGFITLLEFEPFYYMDSAYTVDKLGDYMIEMEETLFAFENSTNAFDHLKDVYIHSLYEIIKGSETTSIVDQDGKVKEEYQLVWKKIAAMDDKMPSAFILQKIVDEMEASEWKKSETHQRLDHENLYNLVDHAKKGDLSSFTFEENDEHGEIVVSPNDPEYQADVEERYTKFSKNHELDYLVGADPLVVVGVYYLANEREDPETMWHLFNHEHIDISLKEYVKDWTKVEPLLEGIDTLSVSIGGSSINGVPYAPISYEEGGGWSDYFTWMIVDKEYSNLWTIQAIPEEIGNP